MGKKLSLKELPIEGKKVLMRVDFNVPLDAESKITDDTRIKAALPSIQHVLDHQGALILMSHLGRPQGKVDTKYSLAPCAKRLSELIRRPVTLAPDCVGPVVEKLARDLKPGEILMLENLRFHAAEEHPEADPIFGEHLARLGNFYVNDAFGTAHRFHTSTAQIASYFPEKAATGFLMEKELAFLGEALLHPKRPFYALIGGAKVSSKLAVIEALLDRCDGLFVGGGMSYTFLKAQGMAIGDSIHEDGMLEEARRILKKGKNLYLPEDSLIADKIDLSARVRPIDHAAGIPAGWQGVDIGPKTVARYTAQMQQAATLFWNGPMGIFEIPPFAHGTFAIARAVAQLSAVTIIGGGETAAAIEASGVADRMTHISTGGGATLEYLEQGTLPGIEALSEVHSIK